MIQIIKKGTRTKATCEECGCVFSYEEEDIESRKHSFYGAPETFIRCPQCECIKMLTQPRGFTIGDVEATPL